MKPKDYIFFSQLITARERAGLTQAELAKKSGVAQLAHYEAGDRLPNFESLSKLSLALGVSLDWLVFADSKYWHIERKAMAFDRIREVIADYRWDRLSTPENLEGH